MEFYSFRCFQKKSEFLIGQQVAAAPLLKQMNLEVLPTSYLLIGTGKPTTAEYVSQTAQSLSINPDIVCLHGPGWAIHGQKVNYLDAGSGADAPVHSEMIKAVKSNTSLPLIVGGGIRDGHDADEALSAEQMFWLLEMSSKRTQRLELKLDLP